MSDPGREAVHVWNALHFPDRAEGHTTTSAYTLLVERDGHGAVRSTRRVPPPSPAPWEARGLRAGPDFRNRVRDLGKRVPGLQSVTASLRVLSRDPEEAGTPHVTGHVLSRVETPAGPVLAGTPWDTDPPVTDTIPSREGRRDTPRGWRDLPLLLDPPVAAVLVSAVRLALLSRGGRRTRERYSGRRLFPRVDLTDLPLAHPEGGVDDAGASALTLPLIRAGALTGLGEGSTTGRAVWDHGAARLGGGPARLDLTGSPTPAGRAPDTPVVPGTPEPTDAVRLTWCLEHLQRYQSDGTVHLTCAAVLGHAPERWFTLGLRARPIALMRRVEAPVGFARRVFSDDEVSTPGLLLPPASRLNHTKGIRVEQI
ncbi:hypothetical protein ACFV4I_21165 [Nocardiopsis alba]|uniref:hypothetical protein n=1 Tax=Nocardiopsis alba TaxID=53437 RepID=UPI0036625146